MGSYDLLKKSLLPIQRNYIAAKRICSLTHVMKQLAKIKITQNFQVVIVLGGLPI